MFLNVSFNAFSIAQGQMKIFCKVFWQDAFIPFSMRNKKKKKKTSQTVLCYFGEMC